ncbi:MAG: hypothetical protein ACP5E3_14745 [Bacteroidales bacterium]
MSIAKSWCLSEVESHRPLKLNYPVPERSPRVLSELVEKTKNYIKEQKEHHKKKTYKEELIELLKLYDVDYDPRYLWDD